MSKTLKYEKKIEGRYRLIKNKRLRWNYKIKTKNSRIKRKSKIS